MTFEGTPLANACRSSNSSDVKRLLELRPENLDIPDRAGKTPLYYATLRGNLEVVKLLLESGCECDHLNSFGDTPLITATVNKRLDLVKILLDAGADPQRTDRNGNSALNFIDSDAEYADELKGLLMDPKYRSTDKTPTLQSEAEHVPRDTKATFNEATSSGPILLESSGNYAQQNYQEQLRELEYARLKMYREDHERFMGVR